VQPDYKKNKICTKVSQKTGAGLRPGECMKSDFINWAMILFAVGVLITGGIQFFGGDSEPQTVAALQQGLMISSK